jgi:SAM-dependent methyltransferase
LSKTFLSEAPETVESQAEKQWQFDNSFTQGYTKIRQDFAEEFLSAVRQQIPLHSAVDVGCGVGYFSRFLSDLGFQVVAVDGREENAAEGRRRYPEINFLSRDVEDPALPEIGVFDFVLCAGLLYHLENPFRAIRNLHALTGKVLMIEGMCAPGNDPNLHLLDENECEDQGLNYVAFYPTEPCLVKMLYRAGFPFVYRFRRLPNDDQFKTTLWRKQSRAFVVASKVELMAPNLVLATEPIRSHFGKGNLWTTWLSRTRDNWAPTREVWSEKWLNLRVLAARYLKPRKA